MLGQRRRRWANIELTLGECLMFAGQGSRDNVHCQGRGTRNTRHRPNAGIPSTTLDQHWADGYLFRGLHTPAQYALQSLQATASSKTNAGLMLGQRRR